MAEYMEGTGKRKKEGLLREEVHRPNLTKLVAFAEEQDNDGTLIPVFLAILEMCFQS